MNAGWGKAGIVDAAKVSKDCIVIIGKGYKMVTRDVEGFAISSIIDIDDGNGESPERFSALQVTMEPKKETPIWYRNRIKKPFFLFSERKSTYLLDRKSVV